MSNMRRLAAIGFAANHEIGPEEGREGGKIPFIQENSRMDPSLCQVAGIAAGMQNSWAYKLRS
jgi:hypothetical protein